MRMRTLQVTVNIIISQWASLLVVKNLLLYNYSCCGYLLVIVASNWVHMWGELTLGFWQHIRTHSACMGIGTGVVE